MATIKLNPILTDIRKRMGSNVFSKWKGTNYVKGYVQPTDRKSEEQILTRNTFSRLVKIWKNIGKAAQNTWNAFASGSNMTGYNAFISENFENMKKDLALIISQQMKEEPVNNFSVTTGSTAGSITCSFEMPVGTGKEVSLFTQPLSNGNGNGKDPITRHEITGASSPLTINGLEPGSDYHVYAVVTEGPYTNATKVSSSVAADVKSGA